MGAQPLDMRLFYCPREVERMLKKLAVIMFGVFLLGFCAALALNPHLKSQQHEDISFELSVARQQIKALDAEISTLSDLLLACMDESPGIPKKGSRKECSGI